MMVYRKYILGNSSQDTLVNKDATPPTASWHLCGYTPDPEQMIQKQKTDIRIYSIVQKCLRYFYSHKISISLDSCGNSWSIPFEIWKIHMVLKRKKQSNKDTAESRTEVHQTSTGRKQCNLSLHEETKRIQNSQNCGKFSDMFDTTFLPNKRQIKAKRCPLKRKGSFI